MGLGGRMNQSPPRPFSVLVQIPRTLFGGWGCGLACGMKPLFVGELSDPDRHALQAGLRSSDGFTGRRCHILLASARGDTTTVIAQAVGCSPQAVRNVLRAFETRGLAVVAMQSRRPHTAAKLFDAERSERLKA